MRSDEETKAEDEIGSRPQKKRTRDDEEERECECVNLIRGRDSEKPFHEPVFAPRPGKGFTHSAFSLVVAVVVVMTRTAERVKDDNEVHLQGSSAVPRERRV